MTFKKLAGQYLENLCPDKRGEARPEVVRVRENRRVGRLMTYFGNLQVDKIGFAECNAYGRANSERKRAADQDLQTLSNVLTYGVLSKELDRNPVLGRARVQKSSEVRHCRSCMPADARALHRVARVLLSNPRSAATGWQMLFEAFTGCRTSEVLGFRMDAAGKGTSGYVEGRFLYVNRSKNGVFPFVEIHPALTQLLAAHQEWHTFESPWYFPGESIFLPLTRFALVSRLRDVCARLGVPQITSHGLRAYYVTLQRSLGRSNEQVAAMIGDKTSSLIETTYGALPEVWSGGDPMTFLPVDEPPAWEKPNDKRTSPDEPRKDSGSVPSECAHSAA